MAESGSEVPVPAASPPAAAPRNTTPMLRGRSIPDFSTPPHNMRTPPHNMMTPPVTTPPSEMTPQSAVAPGRPDLTVKIPQKSYPKSQPSPTTGPLGRMVPRMSPLRRQRGSQSPLGNGRSKSPAPSPSPPSPITPPKSSTQQSKIPIPAFKTIRFLVVGYLMLSLYEAMVRISRAPLVCGYFSHPIVVGGSFWIVLGYMAGYDGMEPISFRASPKVASASKYYFSMIRTYVPAHIIAFLLFSPVWIFCEHTFRNRDDVLSNGLINFALLESWFVSAQIGAGWHGLSWMLSTLTFAFIAIPFFIRSVTSMTRDTLLKALCTVFILSCIPRFAYVAYHGTWNTMDCLHYIKPSAAYDAMQGANPLFALAEMLLGTFTARYVMISALSAPEFTDGATAMFLGVLLWPIWYLIALAAVVVSMSSGSFVFNDWLVRCLVFNPLCLMFVGTMHHQGLAVDDYQRTGEGASAGQGYGLSQLFALPLFQSLGDLVFPVMVTCGPVSYLICQPETIHRFMWSGYSVIPLLGYAFVVIVASFLLHRLFIDQPTVKKLASTLL